MTKKCSIRQRVLRMVGEIVVGSFLIILLLFTLSFVLRETGQLSTQGKVEFSLGETGSVAGIQEEMAQQPYDYVIFDNQTGAVLAGRYVSSDLLHFKAAKEASRNIPVGEVNYDYSHNSHLTLIVRENTLPEFTNHHLRAISYNQFSYLFLLVGLILVTAFSVIRFVRELSRNFQSIQKIALNMGILTDISKRDWSKITEFEDILSHLYLKSEELASLIEKERLEKQDLSFQIAALSHDVKTPLTVLKGNIELFEMTGMTAQQAEFITSMKNSLKVFDRYFNSMMSYTRLLNDDEDYQTKIVLKNFMNELSLELEELVKNYDVNFKQTIESKVETFRGNTLALRRAIVNIFVNACQYAKEGEKRVKLTLRDEDKYLAFEIWNNGKAFSELAQKNANKLFFTEDIGRSGKHYGIGLAFAQVVALKHRGALITANPKDGGAKVIIKVRK